MAFFKPSELLDKQFYTNKPVKAYYNSPGSDKVFTIDANKLIGVSHSYLFPKDKSSFWWLFQDENKRPFFIQHDVEAFNVNEFLKQGVNESIGETKDLSNLEKWAHRIGIIVGVIFIANAAYTIYTKHGKY